MSQTKYTLLDGRGKFLAEGLMESSEDAAELQIRVAPEQLAAVLQHRHILLTKEGESGPSLHGVFVRREGSRIFLEQKEKLGPEMRQNLRIPVSFDTIVYPVSGGRCKVVSYDLSCGGIAFFCDRDFAVGEQMEVVIPMTAPKPLLLQGRILRLLGSDKGKKLYAAKFIDMCSAEEAAVCETVFSIQISQKRA